MNIAGKYRGISPWKPGEYGHFLVEEIRPRRRAHHDNEDNEVESMLNDSKTI